MVDKPVEDKDVMQGGPGQDGKPAEPAPITTKDITIGGKKFSVEPGLADAIEGYRRDINERDGRRGSELETLRRQVTQLEQTVTAASRKPDDTKPEPTGPKPPNPTLQFSDPAAYQAELVAYVNALQDAREAKLRTEYTEAEKERSAASDRQRVWDSQVTRFYEKNPDLKGEEDLVDMIWKANFNDLKNLSLEEGFTKLGDLARERILRYTGKVRDKESPGLEGSRPRPAAQTKPDAEDKPLSLSELIRRKQARMQGVVKPAEK